MPGLVYHSEARVVEHSGIATTSTQEPGALAKRKSLGKVAVLCAGTSDLPVAEEAAVFLKACDAEVVKIYDVGVAGIHRLFANLHELEGCHAAICVAGMDGAMPSVVAGLVQCPVIAVPTSVGYGAALAGVAPLLSMLNACAPGLAVVNIDNGFGAATMAVKILRMARKCNAAEES
ncbi:unnamed protein product [Chrysoparadoxa australica]